MVEVASNDGCLLTCFQQRGVPVQGIDPAANVAAVAEENGVPTEVAFFGAETAQILRERGITADLLIANNVLAHVPDINDFVSGMKQLLQRNGTISVEFPHLLKLIEKSEFDTIYHEHVFYLSLETVRRIFAAHRLAVTDVEELQTHGGSLRVLAKHTENNPSVSPQVDRVIRQEAAAGLNRLETYQAFQQRVRQTKHSLLAFLLDAQRSGKRIAGYGAPAKGTTLLNFCGIDADFIEFTVDRNPQKQHHYIPGTRIPILHPDAINMHRPDYVLILPWNLRDEIMAQLADIRPLGRPVCRADSGDGGAAVIFHETLLTDVLIIEPQRRDDERGYFARLFCRDELRAAGIELEIQQCNVSFNHRRGTLRGLHDQAAPFAEQKIVSCLRGAVYDVALDLREDSPTFGQWHAVELDVRESADALSAGRNRARLSNAQRRDRTVLSNGPIVLARTCAGNSLRRSAISNRLAGAGHGDFRAGPFVAGL